MGAIQLQNSRIFEGEARVEIPAVVLGNRVEAGVKKFIAAASLPREWSRETGVPRALLKCNFTEMIKE